MKRSYGLGRRRSAARNRAFLLGVEETAARKRMPERDKRGDFTSCSARRGSDPSVSAEHYWDSAADWSRKVKKAKKSSFLASRQGATIENCPMAVWNRYF